MKKYKNALIESIIGHDDKVEVVMNVAAGVIMRIDENNTKQILLIQRAEDDHWPGHWEFPRGKCDKPMGENLIKCCKREIKEETGLDIEVLTLIDKFEYLADHGKRRSICHNYLCRIKDPEQKIKLSFEHQDYHWISEVGEAQLMVMPDQKRTIEKVLNSDRTITNNPKNDFTDNNTQLEGYLKWLTIKNQ